MFFLFVIVCFTDTAASSFSAIFHVNNWFQNLFPCLVFNILVSVCPSTTLIIEPVKNLLSEFLWYVWYFTSTVFGKGDCFHGESEDRRLLGQRSSAGLRGATTQKTANFWVIMSSFLFEFDFLHYQSSVLKCHGPNLGILETVSEEMCSLSAAAINIDVFAH